MRYTAGRAVAAGLAAAGLLTAAGGPPAAAGAAAGAAGPGAGAAGPGTVLAEDGGGGGVRIDNTQCTFGSKPVEGTPWSLQRILLDQMWQQTTGRGVKVAVIDTGVDDDHPQLAQALDRRGGADLIKGEGNETTDPVGHGTKVAGIIAARPSAGTGFVGIAPGATIIAIRQNDNQGSGTVTSMVKAIDHAVAAGAQVINISQDSSESLSDDSVLAQAVRRAQAEDVLVVASAGNDGASRKAKRTYPASYEGVLAVAASDRNNERAPFSQFGSFVDVAAPGVDMLSTVPKGGHCLDNGTSFSAPYVAGVAALIRAKHPEWTYQQVTTQILQTAERPQAGRDDNIGWGVVDPVAALTQDDTEPGPEPVEKPAPAPGAGADIQPAAIVLGESPQERTERLAVYAVGGGLAAVALLAGGSIVLRDWRRKNGTRMNGEARHG
ncbi:type VII secretion-associated serine protease mycosin [Streptomyces thermolineatus]|uniref:type VII secretion-associated serine protease mycosin n=1 Tax=Streptomyces thermolineatus TaxID=44033 RepID=UPI0031CEF1E7